MKPSKSLVIGVLAALLLSLTSCNTLRRAGKDAYITVVGIPLILMGASADAYTGAREVRKGYEAGAATEVVAFPFLLFWHAIKHTYYVGAHVLDLPLNVFYGISEISNFGPEIQPIDYYQNTWIDKLGRSGTDAESGESAGK